MTPPSGVVVAIENCWVCGVVEPVWNVKASDPGVGLSGLFPPPDVTFSTIGRVAVLLPAVTVRNVAYVPVVSRPGFAEIDSAWGVVPAGGLTVSQLAAGETLVVNATGPPLDVTVTGCGLEAVPVGVLMVSVDGLNEIVFVAV